METATQHDVSRLGQLLAEAEKLKKPDVIAALVEAGQEEEGLNDQPLGNLRALLAVTRLHQENGKDRPEPDAAPDEPEPAEGEVVDETAEEISKALALREEAPTPQSALPSVAEFNASMEIAQRISKTSFVPTAYRGKPDDVLAAILFGREIGLGPMQSLRDVYMIDGKAALAAHLQLALLRRGGIRILESSSTADRAWIRAQRPDGEIMEVEWTYDEAEKIRDKKGQALVDKDNWRNYRADMLWSRTVGRLTRRLGPDMIGGLPPYVAEEVADFSDWGVNYGETGAAVFTSPERQQQRRQETAGRNEIPHSWAEVAAWAEPYGPTIGWSEWVKDAAERLYATRDSSSLSQQQKVSLLQKASGAIVKLHEIHDPGVFPPPNREEIQRAWAAILDGEILAGPLWRLSPAETEVPTYHAAHDLPEPESPGGEPTAAPEAASLQCPNCSETVDHLTTTADGTAVCDACLAANEGRPGWEPVVDAEWSESAEDIPFGEDDRTVADEERAAAEAEREMAADQADNPYGS